MSTTPQPEPEPDPSVRIALNGMELTSAGLRAAILGGHQEASRTTGNDVKGLDGYLRWAVPLRILGDLFAPNGFERRSLGGFEVLRSPDGAFDIAVSRGSNATGVADRMPTTLIERGPLTGQAVDFNRGQLRLDSDVIPFGPNEPRPGVQPDRLTWLLLHYFDARESELRLELSVPVEFSRKTEDSKKGLVTRFDPRLILPAVAMATDVRVQDDDDDDGDDEIDIPVDRRQ
jgi:hypothetical protein